MTPSPRTTRPARRGTTALALVAAGALSLAGCTAGADAEGDGKVTITITGPNQWNSDASSFGPEWEAQIARFEEAEPDITVETVVLPVSSFQDTLGTQLSAGTASDLVFNQAPHENYMITPLDEFLEEPNPYIDGNERWIDAFDPAIYGPESGEALGTAGTYDFIPFNVFVPVVYYNADAFEEAGISAPIETWEDLRDAAGKLKSAGYVPFAADASDQGLGYTLGQAFEQLMSPYFDELNRYTSNDGEEGPSAVLNSRDWAAAVLTGEITATDTPELAAALELTKEFYDEYSTPNWSGVQASGAAVVNQSDFMGGKAAMAWGSSFGYADVAAADFEVAAMPFPTITTETTPLSSDVPARFGASVYGTSYMIPSTTEGAQLDATVKFLQFMTSPDNVEEWLAETGSFSALADAAIPENLQAFDGSDWLTPRKMNHYFYPTQGTTLQAAYGGFLLGTRTIDEQLAAVQTQWVDLAHQNIEKFGWTDSWATQ